MAKKGKKKLDHDETYQNFVFPAFDVRGFVLHELEQSYASALSIVFAVAVGLTSWQLTKYGLTSALGVVPLSLACFGLGVLAALALVYAIKFVRPASDEYKRGDWAQLLMIYVLGWLALWTLFLNL